MIIEITGVPDIPAFDSVRKELEELIGLKVQVASRKVRSVIYTTSRKVMKIDTEGMTPEEFEKVAPYSVRSDNLLDAAYEKDTRLYEILLDVVTGTGGRYFDPNDFSIDRSEAKEV